MCRPGRALCSHQDRHTRYSKHHLGIGSPCAVSSCVFLCPPFECSSLQTNSHSNERIIGYYSSPSLSFSLSSIRLCCAARLTETRCILPTHAVLPTGSTCHRSSALEQSSFPSGIGLLSNPIFYPSSQPPFLAELGSITQHLSSPHITSSHFL